MFQNVNLNGDLPKNVCIEFQSNRIFSYNLGGNLLEEGSERLGLGTTSVHRTSSFTYDKYFCDFY